MRKSRLLVATLFTMVAMMLSSCSQVAEDIISSDGANNEISFNYELEGVVDQTVSARAAKNIVGKMTIYSHATASDSIIDWYVALDKDTKTLTSNMTLVLPIGVYDFSLLVQDGNYNYLGIQSNISLISETVVDFSVKPVIGDLDVNVSMGNLPSLTFSYPSTELTTIANPKIGYILDDSSETIISLDKATGETVVFINIPEGPHNLKLRFYDGSLLIGTSRPEQEELIINAATDVKMDIIPLVSKVNMSTAIDGGEFTVTINIPSEIIAEVDSLQNLSAMLKIAGPRNAPVNEALVVVPNGDDYQATIVIDKFYHDEIALDIEFKDIASGDIVAHAVASDISVTTNDQAIAISFGLYTRTIVSGNLLATIGVNVYDATDTPVLGAIISVDGEEVGITGTDGFGTYGFLSFMKTAGTYSITAEKYGSTTTLADVVIAPLDVRNIVINMADTIVVDTSNGLDTSIVTTLQLGMGGSHTLFLKENGQIHGVGINSSGQLGDIDRTKLLYYPEMVMTSESSIDTGYKHTSFIGVSAAANFSLMIDKDHSLWTVGDNASGQLGGNPSDPYRTIPQKAMDSVKSVIAAGTYSIIIKEDNSLWMMGSNTYLINSRVPVEVTDDVKSVCEGGSMILILKNDNSLWGLGYNYHNQFGSAKNIALTRLMTDIKSVETSGNHTVITKFDNSLWVMGLNTSYELGDGTTVNRPTPIKVMERVSAAYAEGNQTFIIKEDHTLWAIGANEYGEMGLAGGEASTMEYVQVADDVKEVLPRTDYTFIIKRDNTIWVTGKNTNNRFGFDGDTDVFTQVIF